MALNPMWAGRSPPVNPATGHIWFDPHAIEYKTFDGQHWRRIDFTTNEIPTGTVRAAGTREISGQEHYIFEAHTSVDIEVIQWLTENVGRNDFERLGILRSPDINGITIHLRDESDAVAFALVWC